GESLKVNIVSTAQYDDSRQFFTIQDPTYQSGKTNILILPTDGQNPYLKISNTQIIDYSLLSYYDFCLKDVRQADFIESIQKIFNLYFVQDKNIPKHFNIYTRDEFYSNQNLLDWTDKIDTSAPISIQPIPNLKNQTLFFSYKDDKDYWNKKYTQDYGGIYG